MRVINGDNTVFYYDSYLDEGAKAKAHIRASISISGDKIEGNDFKYYGHIFEEYLRNNQSSDIKEIISGIRNLFDLKNDNKEEWLDVEVISGAYKQKAEFHKGKLENYCFSIKSSGDVIYVSNTEQGTDIRYKKNNTRIDNQKDAKFVYSALNQLFEKAYELKELEKQPKIKTLSNK